MPDTVSNDCPESTREAIRFLAATAAHDLNNLLTAILGSSELLLHLGERLPQEAPEHLSGIAAAAELGGAVTRGVLALLRGGPSAPPAALQVDEMVRNSLAFLRALAGKTTTIEANLTTPHVKILGVESRLQQLLLNLVVNSRNALPVGGVIRFETAEVVEGQERLLELKVHDNGVGMSEEVRARIFDWGFTTTPAKNSGLGLALARRVVEEHGGTIRVDSQPGRFTTFTIRFPVVQSPP
jgi:signal transduction histidine kinase